MNKGDKFVTVKSLDNPASISEPYTLEREDRDYLYAAGFTAKERAEGAGIFHKGFCFPVAYTEELRAIVTKRQELRKAYDNSMSLVYEFANRVKRGEPPKSN